MAIQSINTLRNWFKRGLKPLQQQFWDWMDSYWHKDELIPINKVDQLETTLNILSSTKAPIGANGKIPEDVMPPGFANAFKQGGNSFGAPAELGTIDNYPLSLKTNGIGRLQLASNGNVGIGTATNNEYKLDVNGTTRINDTFTVVTPTSPFEPGGMKVEADGWGRPGATKITVGPGSWFSGFDNQFHFCGYNGNGLTIQSGGAATQQGYYIAPSTGHQGANDSYLRFGVSDSSEFAQGANYPSEQNYYELLTHLNSPVPASNTGATGVRAPLRISARELLFYTGNVHSYDQAALTIAKTGNTLIGTAVDAGYKLDVNGNTRINGTLTMATDNNSLGYITNNSIYGGWFNIDFTANTAGAGGGIRLRHAGNIYAQILTASPTNPFAPIGLLLDVAAGNLDCAVRTAGKLFRWGKTNTINGSGAQMTFDPFNTRLIIGTAPDNGATLQVNGTTTATNDIEINQSDKGVILKSPNGTRFRITVDDNGTLKTTAL